MIRFALLLSVLCVFFSTPGKTQLLGVNLNLPELLHINAGHATPKTTTTTTTTTTQAPTPAIVTQATRKPTTHAPCDHTDTKVKGKKSCKGKLIFSDTFTQLTKTKWQPEVKFAGDPDYEFTIYQNSRDNLYVEKNKLHIRPILTEGKYGTGFVTAPGGLNLGDDCTAIPETPDCVVKPKAWLTLPPAISAQVTTKDHFTFLYGIVEIKARLPKGDWIYPQLYLSPKDPHYGPGLDSGLIKIAFTPGNLALSKTLSGGGVLGQSVAARNFAIKTHHGKKQWNKDFHVFRMEWTPDSITLKVDNQTYANIYPPEEGFTSEKEQLELEDTTVDKWNRGTDFAPFDREMYLILGVGVGGQVFTDENVAGKPWNNDDPKGQLHFYQAQSAWSETWDEDDSAMIVDDIKVWAL